MISAVTYGAIIIIAVTSIPSPITVKQSKTPKLHPKWKKKKWMNECQENLYECLRMPISAFPALTGLRYSTLTRQPEAVIFESIYGITHDFTMARLARPARQSFTNRTNRLAYRSRCYPPHTEVCAWLVVSQARQLTPARIASESDPRWWVGWVWPTQY